MGLWLLVLLVLQAVWKGALGKTHSLHTRGLIELAGAISCGTGRNALAYLGYGCYCGLGGRGWPKDKVDWVLLRGHLEAILQTLSLSPLTLHWHKSGIH
ncbi:unnamed protein product [Eretmochelys imbricata]